MDEDNQDICDRKIKFSRVKEKTQVINIEDFTIRPRKEVKKNIKKNYMGLSIVDDSKRN